MIDNLFYIIDGGITQNMDANNSFKDCMHFCKQWISGKVDFTINTSGSTGTPKPITITRDQMMSSTQMTIQALRLSFGGNALVCLNTSYIAGKMMLVRGMVNGMNLYITEPSSNPLLDVPPNLAIDFMAVVPLQLEDMIDSKEPGVEQLNKLQAMIVGGAPVSRALCEKIKKLNCPVYATYGMTETVSHIALKRLNGIDVSDYYTVLDGVQIGQDDRGCLTILSVLTNNQTIITNDVVNIIDPKTFEWLGRADHIINSGGIKIHPEQLENQVKSILEAQGIHDNMIIVGIPDKSLGEKVVLILECKESVLGVEVLESLKLCLKQELPLHHSPRAIYLLKTFIYTETGKVKRNATKQRLPTSGKS